MGSGSEGFAAFGITTGAGYLGTLAGEKLAEMTRSKAPASLNEGIQFAESDKPVAGASMGDIVNQRMKKQNEMKRSKKELPQANMRTDLSNLPVEDVMGQYREMVGRKGGGQSGYDAIYGAGTEAGVQKYMKDIS